jgi:hypothetical protein
MEKQQYATLGTLSLGTNGCTILLACTPMHAGEFDWDKPLNDAHSVFFGRFLSGLW